jgi:hypothetical protein
MAVTDTTIRNAKPSEKPVKVFDGGGLYLIVHPNGGRWWRFRYRYDGKEKLLSLGVYPQVSLKDARAKRDEARKQLAAGADPSAARKQAKASAAEGFESVAREWYGKHAPRWGQGHADNTIRCLERDVFPWLGARPVGKVTAPEVLACLRRIESRGAIETAHRALQNCGHVFRYAMASGRAERDPPPICAARCNPPRKPTTRPLQTPRPWARCCAQSMATRATWRPAAPYGWHRLRSFGPASCAPLSGRSSTLRPASGTFPQTA